MTTRLSSLSLLGVLVAAAPAFAGDDWHSQPYDHDGLGITAKEIVYSKGKLWLKLQFINSTENPMTVTPDSIQAKLPTGATVTRAKGVFGDVTKTRAARTIPPGAGELIPIEFEIGDAKSAALQLNFGVALNGKVKKFPEWVATSTVSWTGPAKYHAGNLSVFILSSSLTKGGVEFKMKVDNQNDAPIYIAKKLFKAKLPGGSEIPREKTLMKNTLTILGHTSDDFNIEFKVGDPVGMVIVMDGINNGELKLPDLPLKRQ